MKPSRYFRDTVHDDFADAVDKIFGWPFPYVSTTKGTLVNTEDYDIIPKKHTVERKIKDAEQRLQELKDRRANYNRTWDEQQKQIEDEIYDLKKKLSP